MTPDVEISIRGYVPDANVPALVILIGAVFGQFPEKPPAQDQPALDEPVLKITYRPDTPTPTIPYGDKVGKLLEILADGHVHSVPDITTKLKMKAPSLRKLVQRAREENISIKNVRGAGYLLQTNQ